MKKYFLKIGFSKHTIGICESDSVFHQRDIAMWTAVVYRVAAMGHGSFVITGLLISLD